MGRVGGGRNFGYGKQMAWAGKNALSDRYGDGHYGTQASHGERWNQFTAYAKEEGIRDLRQVDIALVTAYGESLREQVATEVMAVSYAQNLLSSVNVILETMRGDSLLRVSPAELVGERNNVRQAAPVGLARARLQQAVSNLHHRGEPRVATIAELARELGLRFREASLLDSRSALQQAEKQGIVNITAGTKGGRGQLVDRWVPVSPQAVVVLQRAAELQGNGRNLTPDGSRYSQWRDHAYHAWSKVAPDAELKGFHDLRAAYACERYAQLTGHPAPVVAGERETAKGEGQKARAVISAELGHGRVDVVAYLGSGR